MSLTTRAAGAIAVLSLAAIPVAALSLQGPSWDTPPTAADERVAAGTQGPDPDCCSANAPAPALQLASSRLVSQNISLDSEIAGLTDDHHAVKGDTALQHAEPSEIETSSTTAADSEPAPPRKRVVKRKKAPKTTAGAGSFQLLFQGSGKK